MRANIIILSVIAAFFFVASAVYTVWVIAAQGQIEWAGTLAMALTGVLSAFIAFYLWLVHRGQGGEILSDVHDAEIDDEDPELGHFSPWSWWPIGLAGALAIVFLGLAGPYFLMPIGAGLLVVMLVGWVYEYYRGSFSR